MPVNFVEAETFAPERWLPEGAERFKDDNKAVYQPFGVGPRGCLGKAYVDFITASHRTQQGLVANLLRLALMVANRAITALVKNFDMELCSGMETWDEGQIYNVSWGRPPLYVVLRERE
jgi:hypothetical protein